MQSTIDYECIETNNKIEVVITDGRIDGFFINKTDYTLLAWITIDDLEAAIQLAKDEIKEMERTEMKLS